MANFSPGLPLATLLKASFGTFILVAGCWRTNDSLPTGTFDAGSFQTRTYSEVTYDFKISNTTSRDVRIEGITQSCACAKIKLASNSVEAGKFILAHAKLRIPAEFEDKSVQILVKTDHPRFPNWPFLIRFRTYPEIMLESDHINLGHYRILPNIGDPTRTFPVVTFAPPGQSGVDISTIDVPSPLLARMSGQPTRLLFSDSFTKSTSSILFCMGKGPRAVGTFSESAIVALTNAKKLVLTLTWTVEAEIDVVPSQVFALFQPSDQELTKRVAISSRDGNAFEILSIEHRGLRAPDVSHRILTNGGRQQQASRHEIDLSFSRTRFGPVEKGAVVLRTNRSDSREIVVPWALLKKPKS